MLCGAVSDEGVFEVSGGAAVVSVFDAVSAVVTGTVSTVVSGVVDAVVPMDAVVITVSTGRVSATVSADVVATSSPHEAKSSRSREKTTRLKQIFFI